MKKYLTLLLVVVLLCSALAVLGACQELVPEDITALVQFDKTTATFKMQLTVKNYVDGDTTHFNVSRNTAIGGVTFSDGVLKARYIAVDTPESTNVLEDYGKKASKFTKEKLSTAKEIWVESDTEDNKLNPDSTGSRYVLWIWYLPKDGDTYRCLNIELLQNGLAKPSNSAANRYGSYCTQAIDEAKRCKLNVWSGKKDPEMYDGPTIVTTLKDLRTNLEEYNGKRVGVEGIVTNVFDNTAYIEAYDEVTGISYGMACYYGFSKLPQMISILSVGNKVYVAGSVQYYETGGTYQLADLRWDLYPEEGDVDCVKLLEKGHEGRYVEISGSLFADGTLDVKCADGVTRTFGYAELTMNTTVSMKNLKVTDVYTTKVGNSAGAMTLTCTTADGKTITIRTNVFTDENGDLITESAYKGKTINVKGLVEYFDGQYQIKAVTPEYIEVL